MPARATAPLIEDAQPLTGRRVLLTGGTTGIGRALLERLVAEGARVLTFGRDESDLESALAAVRAGPGEARGVSADASRIADVRRVFGVVDEWLGDVDVLVNNAAVDSDDFADEPLDRIDYIVRANVVGYLACAHEAVRRMERRGAGHIVLIGSMSADLREEGGSTYVATKGAIQAFAESLRKTVNEAGIKVTLIEPGKVATDMVGRSARELEEAIAAQRMLRPADIAGAVLFALQQPARCDVVSLQIRPHRQVI